MTAVLGLAEAQAQMVDVTAKDVTAREATASCLVKMSAGTRDLVARRALPKGDALEVARIAGIIAAKKTSDLIPLCHPIGIGAPTSIFSVQYGSAPPPRKWETA